MEWLCVGAAGIVGVLGLGIVLRGGVYRRIFADDHFLEVARGLASVKASALELAEVDDREAPPPPTDMRTLVTSAGLALFYTINRDGDEFHHHYSVSYTGGYTAHAVGETFVLFVARLLGVPFPDLSLAVGRSTVHHAVFRLRPVAHHEFAARLVPEVTPDEVAAFRREWIEASNQLRWQRLEVPPR